MSRFVNAKQREALIALIIFIGLFALVTSVKVSRQDGVEGDTAIIFQATENIARRGVAVSEVATNTLAAIESGRLAMTADQIAKDPLSPPPAAKETNIMTVHAYYILYPIAVLVRFFPVDVVLYSLWTLTFIGLVAMAYFALRRKNVSIAGAILFCLLLVSYPGWSESLLEGQFYVDRLFVLAGFFFMYLASRENTSRSLQIAAGVLCMLINERGAITAGAFLLLYVLLNWRRAGLDRNFKLAFSFILLAYGTIIIKLIISNSYYSSFLPTSVGQIIANFQQPAFAHGAALFVLVNSPFILLALFEWRAAVIAIVLMLPNFLGSIGGAEKIGWATHYHSYYIPALVWAAILGYAAVYRKATAVKRLAAAYALGAAFAMPIVLAIFLSLLDPYSAPGPSLSPSNSDNTFFLKLNRQAGRYLGAGSAGASLRAANDKLRRVIPAGSDVTAPEGAMTALYHDRIVRFLPMGIDTADFAVLAFSPSDKGITYNGAVSYLSPEEAEKIDRVIVARMKKDRYDFRHEILIPEISLAVIKRLK